MTPRLPRPIVVNAPDFDERSGGSIVLHRLVDRLRGLGHDAYVHPLPGLADAPPWPELAPGRRWRTWRRNRRARRRALERYRTHPSLDTPRAPDRLLREAIAVYPETVSGNPMRSRHVVRWLLNRPGFFRPNVRFGANEITFFYQHAFREGLDWVDPDNLLQVRWIRDDVYFDRGLLRDGACRLIRKGALTGMAAVPENDDAVVIDGMSHEDMAEVFNRTRVLYSHDAYTMYVYYAALCGCVPVVLPQPGLSREAWRTSIEFKHGIAYGLEEYEWALATREALLSDMDKAARAENDAIEGFVRRLSEFVDA